MYMTSDEIRQTFLDYFSEFGHAVVASSPLIPAGDPTLLFANSGMVQFKDTFLGLEKRPYARATTAQKCMRVSGKHNDFENVGPSPRHHTFFEMLGNFSFGDYFKKEAIQFAWDLLTTGYGLDPQRLWFTIFEGDSQIPPDEEAARFWQEVGAPPERILRFGRKDNFWQMGETGPAGPNSEIHYYRGEHPNDPAHNRAELVNGDGDTTLEIWNLVFMQYELRSDGSMVALPKPSVDTGAGLERVAAVLQGKDSNYDTDLFQPIIQHTLELLHQPPSDYEKRGASYRVIADHARAVTFLIADGVNPSNEGRGYVTRLILRRAARHGQLLGFEGPFLGDIIPKVIELMRGTYPEVEQRRDYILRTVRAEEEKFLQTLRVGSQMLDDLIAEAKRRGVTEIAGQDAFRLYDTYGFPLDLTREVARENNMTVDEREFRAAMETASERSRSASTMGKVDDVALRGYRSALEELRAPGRLGGRGVKYDPYQGTRVETTVAGILQGGKLVESIGVGERAQIVLAETCFYVEGGGQISDIGTIIRAPRESNGSGDWEFRVDDTRQPIPGLIIHSGEIASGRARGGDKVVAEVDAARRLDIMRNHTATHLLHAELRKVLGEHVQQAGSLVAPDRLRFDFTHIRPVTADESAQIQAGVNQAILENYPVQPYQLPYKEAIGRGAMALFTEKYGDVVRMMEIDDISRELCGGTHVQTTGQIGLFHITAEASVGAGVRRIEAVTAKRAYEELQKGMRVLEQVSARLRVSPEQVGQKLSTLIEQVEARDKEIARLHRELAKRQAQGAAQEQVQDVDGIKVLARLVDAPTLEFLREQSDYFRERIGSGVVAVGAVINDKPNLIVAVTPDAVERGLDARQIIGAAAKLIGGGGGGKPTLAQAGGRDASKLQDALDFIPAIIAERKYK